LGGINLYTGSAGGTIATNSAGLGMGSTEGVELSVLSRQAQTSVLLGEDEFGNVIVEETTPLLEDGIELTEIGAETAVEAAGEGAVAAGEAAAAIGEGAAAAVEGGVTAAEIGTAVAEGGVIAAEGAGAVALAPETMGASLVVGGLVMAGTEIAIHSKQISKALADDFKWL